MLINGIQSFFLEERQPVPAASQAFPARLVTPYCRYRLIRYTGGGTGRFRADCKRSLTNEAASSTQRLVLPRHVDAVADTMRMLIRKLRNNHKDVDVEQVVLDFEDVYYMVPLAFD